MEYGAQPMHFDIYEFLRFPPFLCYVCYSERLMCIWHLKMHLQFQPSADAYSSVDDFKNRTRKKDAINEMCRAVN